MIILKLPALSNPFLFHFHFFLRVDFKLFSRKVHSFFDIPQQHLAKLYKMILKSLVEMFVQN